MTFIKHTFVSQEEKPSKPLGGTITQWDLLPTPSKDYVVYGRLIKDLRSRFAQNEHIQTSWIEHIEYDTELKEGILITRNTTYSLSDVRSVPSFLDTLAIAVKGTI